jgi:hypothetical protein
MGLFNKDKDIKQLHLPGFSLPLRPGVKADGTAAGFSKISPAAPPKQTKGRGSTSAPAPVSDKDILNRWNYKGAKGFYHWLRDMQPRCLNSKNRWEVWEPTPEQRRELQAILKTDSNGDLLHSLCLLIQPRRHGKSTIFRMLLLWQIMSKRNFLVQLLAATEMASRRTQFKPLTDIIKFSPKLRALFQDPWLTQYEINYPPMNSKIQMSSGTSKATAFGEKLNALYWTDAHTAEAETLQVWGAFQASLLDSEGSVTYIDSNVDAYDQHVHDLQREAANDENMHCTHVEYKDLEEYNAKAPNWIDRKKVARLQKTQLDVDFKRDILGQRSSATNSLFNEATIKKSKDSYKIPVANVSEFLKGRAYKIAGGLDRAKSLIGGDRSVWTVLLKTVCPDTNEPEFYILSQKIFQFNASRFILKQIIDDHAKYDLCNVALENYEVADLAPRLADKNIKFEIVNPTSTWQNTIFPRFAEAAKNGRFHFSKYQKTLLSEMRTFVYKLKPGGGQGYVFQHASDKFKDDSVFSVAHAMFALRDQVLHTYQLGNFSCMNRKASNRHLCILFGGDHSLLCRIRCPAYQQVEDMYENFKRLRPLDECTIEEFFKQRVEIVGARISQAI